MRDQVSITEKATVDDIEMLYFRMYRRIHQRQYDFDKDILMNDLEEEAGMEWKT